MKRVVAGVALVGEHNVAGGETARNGVGSRESGSGTPGRDDCSGHKAQGQ